MSPVALKIYEARYVVSARLLCSTPEMSEKLHLLREGFRGAMIRTPAGPYLALRTMQEIIWKKLRKERDAI